MSFARNIHTKGPFVARKADKELGGSEAENTLLVKLRAKRNEFVC